MLSQFLKDLPPHCPMRAPGTQDRRTGRARRGSAMSLMIVVSVIVSGMVMSLAWSGGTTAQFATQRIKTDEGLYAAEGALQWAIFEQRADPTWKPSGTSPIVNGWTCAISYVDLGTPVGLLGNPLKFTVAATKAGVNSTGTAIAVVDGAIAYAPQFFSIGDLTIAQSATILGDVETQGKLTINPPTSGGVVSKGAKGTVKAKKAVTDNNPGPAGSGKYFTTTPVANALDVSNPPMSAQQLFNTLKAGPTVPLLNIITTDPATGNYIIDFSLAGGKPAYYNGPANYIGTVGVKSSANPSKDTLLMDGPANFTGTYPFNAATAPMNLLINGDVTFNGSGAKGIAITGSFYVTGNWTQTGMYNFKGTVMVDKTTTLNGTGTVDVATPPAFDPRFVPRITNYYGLLP